MNILRMAAVSAMALLLAVSANAAEPAPRNKIFVTNSIGGRINPVGVSDTVTLAYGRYFGNPDSMLTRNNHVFVGVTDSISPASNAIGAFVEIEPIAVFNVRVTYEYLSYFGAFSSLALFPSRNSDYSDSVREYIDDEDLAIVSDGTHFSVQPTFQIQWKRFIAMNTASFEWFDVNENGYFYELTNDTLMKTKDYFFSNSAIAGVTVWGDSDDKRIIVGARYVYFSVEESGKRRQELDGALVWMMGEKLWKIEKPVLFVIAGTNLEDQYRQNEFFTGAMFNCEFTLFEK